KNELSFSAAVKTDDFRKLEVLVNDNLKESYIVGPQEQFITLYLSDVSPGETSIKFKTFKNNNELITEEDSSIMFSKINYKEIDEITIPELYKDILNEEGEFSILPIPAYNSYSFNNLEEKKINNKKIITLDDLVSEENINFNFDANYYLLENLLSPSNTDPEKISLYNYSNFNKDYYSEALKQLPSHYNLKYIVFDKNLLDSEQIDYYKKLIEDSLEVINIKEDDQFLAYELENPKITKYPLFLGEGWGALIGKEGEYLYRRIEPWTHLTLVNPYPENRNLKLSFDAKACGKPGLRFLRIYLNYEPLGEYTISGDIAKTLIDLPDISPGKNNIQLEVFDENHMPMIEEEEEEEKCTINFSDLKLE
ncbi:MAG: hypothetical protein ACFFG0_21970, partial [Candidatus Thorarchaeota archaeon]